MRPPDELLTAFDGTKPMSLERDWGGSKRGGDG